MNLIRAITDNRMVIDVVAPGFTEKDFSVKRIMLEGKVEIKIKSTIKKGVGFYKTLIGYKYKETINIDIDVFNLEEMTTFFENGVLRISIPKTEEAIGIKVFPESQEE
jgi:HSP20 family molecular chaperone IbpA